MIKKITDKKLITLFNKNAIKYYIPYNNCQLVEMFKNNYLFYGYFLNNILIAFIVIMDLKEEFELINVVVKQKYHNQGIGSELLSYVIDNVIGNNKLFLEVNVNNRQAIKLYEKKGFVIVGKREKYYSNKDDALLMMFTKK